MTIGLTLKDIYLLRLVAMLVNHSWNKPRKGGRGLAQEPFV